jgi:hypothetical protein
VSITPAAKESSPARTRLTETTHYAAGTPYCEQKITVKNRAFLAMMRRSAARVGVHTRFGHRKVGSTVAHGGVRLRAYVWTNTSTDLA